MIYDQKRLIHNSNWDLLIILDACRFDCFRDNYDGFLSGNLHKVKSRASSTSEWLTKTFDCEYNYTYLSANPHINSLGLSLKEGWDYQCEWVATKHFEEIHDIWLNRWSEEAGSVYPSEMNKAYYSKGAPDKAILHYVQPHTPYLGHRMMMSGEGIRGEMIKACNKDIAEESDRVFGGVRDWFGSWVQKNFDKKTIWKVRQLLGLKPINNIEAGFRSGNLHELYTENLKRVLQRVYNFTSDGNIGKIVITADHGELLGDRGEFGHPVGSDHPKLRYVPWLEVKR